MEVAMIDKILFGGKGWSEMKSALDAGSVRQRVLASNIANAETPGYKAQEVVFEDVLRGEEENGKLALAKTSAGHLSGTSTPTAKAIVRDRGGEVPPGAVNDVQIEREMNEMVQNQIHFQAVSQLLANRYKSVRDAIRSGV
jgi:flagellar basal-body rod protein FlgB